MEVGISLNILQQAGRSDAAVMRDHLAMGDLAEPLGLDSIFALEHHFTGYSMSPQPTQLLAYFAGRTRRVKLGTAVIVLPWHDPVRVAEMIAQLDIMCGGRCLFGFGRGAGRAEYDGFRIDMGEARPRFVEAAEVVIKALREAEFEHNGEFFQIPKMSIRPRPISRPEERFYASSVSPESAEVIAGMGLGMLVIMQNEWAKCAEDVVKFHEMTIKAGHKPRPPIISTNIACAESRDEAVELGQQYLGNKWDSIEAHYKFSDGGLANVKGYESYGKMAKTYTKMKDPGFRKKANEFYVSIQVVGTPKDCLEQIAELRRLTGTEHLVGEYSFGGMPHERAEQNLRLFAQKCVPILQTDETFCKSIVPAGISSDFVEKHEDVFAPA